MRREIAVGENCEKTQCGGRKWRGFNCNLRGVAPPIQQITFMKATAIALGLLMLTTYIAQT